MTPKFALLARLSLTFSVALSSCACGGPAAPLKAPVQKAPSGPETFQKGRQALLRGDHTRAEQYLKLALNEGHEPNQTVLLLVHACLSGSRFRAALNYAEPHLRQHPKDKTLRYLVATIHLGLDHRDDGLRHLNLLAQQAPDYADTYFLRGATRWHERDARAQADFEHYLSLAPEGRHAAEVRSLLSDMHIVDAEPQALQWAHVAPDAVAPQPEETAP